MGLFLGFFGERSRERMGEGKGVYGVWIYEGYGFYGIEWWRIRGGGGRGGGGIC